MSHNYVETSRTQETEVPFISIILPLYNEEAVIAETIRHIIDLFPTQIKQSFEIIVVDDGSQDSSVAQVQALKNDHIHLYQHPYNIGPGAAIKTGIRQARGEVLVILDADGQHPPEAIPRLLEKIGPYDMVVAARTAESGADWHRTMANWVYNRFATYMCDHHIEDLTCSFRAIKADIAHSFINLLPNTFSYPTTLTMATVRSGYSLAFEPIQAARRVGKSKINLLQDGTRFFMIILKVATLFSPFKIFTPVSVGMFTVGFGYGLFKVLFLGMRYGPTSAMLMTMALIVFLIGLISEQITQLRFDQR